MVQVTLTLTEEMYKKDSQKVRELMCIFRGIKASLLRADSSDCTSVMSGLSENDPNTGLPWLPEIIAHYSQPIVTDLRHSDDEIEWYEHHVDPDGIPFEWF